MGLPGRGLALEKNCYSTPLGLWKALSLPDRKTALLLVLALCCYHTWDWDFMSSNWNY